MKESLFLLTLLHDEKLTYHLLLLVCSFGMGATGYHIPLYGQSVLATSRSAGAGGETGD